MGNRGCLVAGGGQSWQFCVSGGGRIWQRKVRVLSGAGAKLGMNLAYYRWSFGILI